MVPRKQTNSIPTFVLLAVLSTGATLQAEEEKASFVEAPAFEQLAPYVVVSTRTPIALERTSPSVAYISAEDIESWQNRDLVDVLNQELGMGVITSGGEGAQTSLFVRGTESNHTGFFLEGRRLSPAFGNQYDLNVLSVGNVESIQIQRGASSVNYGSSGIGGVVDTTLKSGLGAANSGFLEVEYGSNDYKRGGFGASVGTDQFGITLSGSTLSTDNERPNDDYEKEQVNSRVDYQLTDSLSFELIGQYIESEKGLPNSVITPNLIDVQDVSNWLLSPGLRYSSDDLSVHLFYSRSKSETDLDQVKAAFGPFPGFDFLGIFPVSNSIEVISDEVNLQVDYSINESLLLTTGLLYRKDDASNTNLNTFNPLDPAIPYSENFEQAGAYAQLIWLVGDLEFRGGLRYDDYSDFEAQTTGNFEAVYYLDSINAAVFSKIATSYAPASAVDVAFDSDTSTALQPEESVSYEIGFRQSLWEDQLVYSVVLFRNEIDNLLSFEPTTFDTFNVEEATTEGVELSVAYQATDDLSLSLGYTYLTAVSNRLNDPRTAAEAPDFAADPARNVPLARRPRHLLQLSADYQFTESFHAGIQGVGHIDRQDIDPVSFLQVEAESYFVVRLVADWKLSEDVTLFTRVENLLDEAYAPAAGFPALGRTGYIGARYSF